MKIAIINGFDTYEHRVDLIYKYFTRNGNHVSVFTSNYQHIEKKKRNKEKENFTYIETMEYKRNLSIDRILSHIKLSKDIFSFLENDYDLLWVLVPPNSLVKQGIKYKRKNKTVKLVFDLIDLWPETMPIGKLKDSFPFKLWKNIRDKNLYNADHIVTECKLFQNFLPKEINPLKISNLYLSYGNDIIARNFNMLNLSGQELSLCYLGSMNNIIDNNVIKNIIQSLSKNYKVKFHIIGDGEKKSELLQLIDSISNLEIIDHGKIYDNKLKNDILSTCHFGLNIMKKDVLVGLTMKSLDYFKNGIPIINNINGDTWEFVENYGVGINTTDGFISSLVIQNYLENFAKIQDFYQNKFSEDTFNVELSKILKEILDY
ncbi:hypothetical protein CGZ53_05285 [Streptococcus uberis]|uniref:hypothetical protein n=1 Tax=Streptococcus uberis TaxID=1349 RepID=UPI000C2D2766|nr:hypothetical protein [Streptococcus uberis]AUC25090.1 hypothetical protein CGZ53_05285 [Streptococcus uberis]